MFRQTLRMPQKRHAIFILVLNTKNGYILYWRVQAYLERCGKH